MKILIIGTGPIGRWLAIRLSIAGLSATLLARRPTSETLENGITITDGLTGERITAQVKLTETLAPEDRYDLIIVALQKKSRRAACALIAENRHAKHVLFLGNDVTGFSSYVDLLAKETVLLGFPGVGGGWDGASMVVIDRERPSGPHGVIYLGELDGSVRQRTRWIKRVFEEAGIAAQIEKDMDGWLKYHFAFVAPTAGILFQGGGLSAVAEDPEAIHSYCRACREAGDVLAEAGYRKRQPFIFNLYYWLPRRLEPLVFKRLFGSRSAEVRFGLHAKVVGPEIHEMAREFEQIKSQTACETPTLDALIARIPEVVA